MELMNRLWFSLGFVVFLVGWVYGSDYSNVTYIDFLDGYGDSTPVGSVNPLMVELTLIQGADSKGAVCLDGTLPGYHFHPGSGSGADSWVIQLEGGGWCNNRKSCVFRKTTRRGSSKYMEKVLAFTGILSNKAEENPDFYNWNRIKVRYCDGASFTGEGQEEKPSPLNQIYPQPKVNEIVWLEIRNENEKTDKMYYRGQRIWEAAMEELMKKGMRNASEALLSGCSAGGLASILHCDEFRDLFPASTKVKCLSDAGLFLDAVDVSGERTMRDFYQGVVNIQNVGKNLPASCTNHSDPTTCFFPENIISNIKTPMFTLNTAYDSWQVGFSLAPSKADPNGEWRDCKANLAHCTASQIQFFQGFRNQMLNAVKNFSTSSQNGLFLNSCFAHCQSERQDTWFAPDSPAIGRKRVALAVGDWFFDRLPTKLIDCPYPCDNTCHNLMFSKASILST